jgi:ABC-type uncharacterized transport system substrate-binding protein
MSRARLARRSRVEPRDHRYPVNRMTRAIALALTLAAAALGGSPAFAHPHVWVTAKAEIIYAADGKITGIRHAWTFDKGYSAFITQGLDKNKDGKLTPDELLELAKENTESLVDFEYFTVLKTNGAKQAFGTPRDYGMTFADEAATLSYLLPLKAPAPAAKVLSLEVYDPSFFVSFALAEGNDAVGLAGAPKGCTATLTRPKAIDTAKQQNLSESFFQALSAASDFGGQFANRAIVACP